MEKAALDAAFFHYKIDYYYLLRHHAGRDSSSCPSSASPCFS